MGKRHPASRAVQKLIRSPERPHGGLMGPRHLHPVSPAAPVAPHTHRPHTSPRASLPPSTPAASSPAPSPSTALLPKHAREGGVLVGRGTSSRCSTGATAARTADRPGRHLPARLLPVPPPPQLRHLVTSSTSTKADRRSSTVRPRPIASSSLSVCPERS
jgi:hypothetical protein